MAVFELACFREGIEAEGDGARDDVAGLLDVVEERNVIEAAARAELFEHVVVRLVEDAAVEVCRCEIGFCEHVFHERRHGAHGEALADQVPGRTLIQAAP